jgi:hypothetical protein
MMDGKGDPNVSPDFQAAVVALYKLAYGIRTISKAAGSVFTVMPLEGLWHLQGDPGDPTKRPILSPEDKARFAWTLIILALQDLAW